MVICLFEKMRLYSFEKLEVWQLSKKLVVEIYGITNQLPDSEKFGVTSQLRRAAFSVPNNLVEGSTRRTPKDKARFIEIAYGSLLEVLNILIICLELGFIEEKEMVEFRISIEEIGNKLNALRRSILKTNNQITSSANTHK